MKNDMGSNMADKQRPGTPKALNNQVANPSGLLRDDSLEDLRTHLNQWWKARVANTAGGNLNDHNYLIGVVKDMVQDTGELFNITLGILDRLTEVNDLEATDV